MVGLSGRVGAEKKAGSVKPLEACVVGALHLPTPFFQQRGLLVQSCGGGFVWRSQATTGCDQATVICPMTMLVDIGHTYPVMRREADRAPHRGTVKGGHAIRWWLSALLLFDL